MYLSVLLWLLLCALLPSVLSWVGKNYTSEIYLFVKYIHICNRYSVFDKYFYNLLFIQIKTIGFFTFDILSKNGYVSNASNLLLSKSIKIFAEIKILWILIWSAQTLTRCYWHFFGLTRFFVLFHILYIISK